MGGVDWMSDRVSWVILIVFTVGFAVLGGVLWHVRERLVGHGVFASRGVVLYAFALSLIVCGLGLAALLVKAA
jgi:uncharacterized iron-regulated membrane protein